MSTTVEFPVTVTKQEIVRQVVSGGTQGPRGPVGSSGSELNALIAAVALSGHRTIAINADGQGIYADSSSASVYSAIGISVGAASGGAEITVRQSGALDWPAGGLTPGVPLFLGADGYISHTPPATGYVRQIAVALDTNRIHVGLGPVIQQE